MAKYIDADRLKAEIERLTKTYQDSIWRTVKGETAKDFRDKLLSVIESLQRERPDDVVVVAKTFLDALSKTSYNNKPITDAQIIVKQLLLFFENPKEYNPDAILEQPEGDLEKVLSGFTGYYAHENSGEYPSAIDIARHFYELGCRRTAEMYDEIEYNRQRAEESVPNDLEEAAKNYAMRDKWTYEHFGDVVMKAVFFGAKWQAEQDQETIELAEDHAYLAGAVNEREKILSEAVEGEVRKDGTIGYFEFSNEQQFHSLLEQFQDYDKVRIIIVKEVEK